MPDFWIIYSDIDAVMFDQLLIDLPKDVAPPCMISATEYAGMHNAGFYCIYPTKLKEMTQEISFVDCATLWTQVLSDEESAAACRISDNDLRALLRGNSDTYSLQRHNRKCYLWYGEEPE